MYTFKKRVPIKMKTLYEINNILLLSTFLKQPKLYSLFQRDGTYNLLNGELSIKR